MAAQKKPTKINLLPKEEFETTTIGRILKWLLSTFRIIVIFTEMTVMMAFLSRFYLDARSNDLTDEIKQKQALISSLKNTETEFRSLQNRLKILSDFTSDDKKNLPRLTAIIAQMPGGLELESISFTPENIQLAGNSLTESTIAQWIANLDSTRLFQEVSLTQVTSKKNDAFVKFNISITLAQKEPVPAATEGSPNGG